MPQVYKQLFASVPAATTLTDAYTVEAATQVIVSSLSVCNRSATPTTFRLAHAPLGAADAVSQYVYYDAVIAGNTTLVMTSGITMAATDKLRVYVGAATVTFLAWGEERT